MNFNVIGRRDFLKIGLAAALSGVSEIGFTQVLKKTTAGLSVPEMANPFVVVFLRGGADGLSIPRPSGHGSAFDRAYGFSRNGTKCVFATCFSE